MDTISNGFQSGIIFYITMAEPEVGSYKKEKKVYFFKIHFPL